MCISIIVLVGVACFALFLAAGDVSGGWVGRVWGFVLIFVMAFFGSSRFGFGSRGDLVCI